MQQPSTFQVYNASAGSGKTYTLVKEYLKKILETTDIYSFQSVLAITFTNKAANEMKERVLNALHSFSQTEPNDLFNDVANELTLDHAILKERSGRVLQAVLENYSAFYITTIDSFTHKIIRSFAYDLGLPQSFEVEMDANKLLIDAVEVLISKIGTNVDLTKLLIDYSLDKTNQDTSWDISYNLLEFSKILLNENDTPHFKNLADNTLQDFESLKNKLAKRNEEIKIELQGIGEKGLSLISNQDLSSSDFYRSMLPNHFKQLKLDASKAKYFDKSALKSRIDSGELYLKSIKQDVQIKIEQILPELIDFYNQSETFYSELIIIRLLLKSVIPLAVLNNVQKELEELKEENNIRLNSEFNQLIFENIQEQPAPFIYERIGQRFKHFFIDEMQDTSVLQWENLIPLIDNALSQEDTSLTIVGDGKQSIYRWRGGKPEQFIDLGSEDSINYNPFHIEKEVKLLDTNYRSYDTVVKFNNEFFKHVSTFISDSKYKSLYETKSHQKPSNKIGGYVSIQFLDDVKEQEDPYAVNVFNVLRNLDHDFSYSDVCVLVRTKSEGVTIANYLQEQQIDIVSSETLLLKNSSKVEFIITFLKYWLYPEPKLRFEILSFIHQHFNVQQSLDAFLEKHIEPEQGQLFLFLEEIGVQVKIKNNVQLPLFEFVELIVDQFQLMLQSDAYVQFFLDEILMQQKKEASIESFLDYWEQKKESLSIVAKDHRNAVQILTIHKSKGLEFPIVIFPCDLNIYKEIQPKTWISDDKLLNPFSEFLVPYNKELEHVNSTTRDIVNERNSKLELDNLNLLYVALTRAEEQLYIITVNRVDKKGEEHLNYYSGFFINYLKQEGLWNGIQTEYTFGNPKKVSPHIKNEQKYELQDKLVYNSWQDHQLNLLASSSKLWDTKQGEAINYGNLIHEIMASIYNRFDVIKTIDQYAKHGFIKEKDTNHIKGIVDDIVHHSETKEFFKEGLTVFNERELVSIDGQVFIPDRLVFLEKSEVVIMDYKTGSPSNAHHQQLLKYEKVLGDMGFKTTKKILIYINEEVRVEEI